MRLPAFEYHAPTALDEVLALLLQHGSSARLMGGGTDLLRNLQTGKIRCEHVIGLRRVRELDGITFDPARGLRIGAGARLDDVGNHAAVREHFPALAAAIDTLATVQVRHKATVAGNLCNASPCADTATPLMAYGARVAIAGFGGRRELPLEEFVLAPGRTALAPQELLESLHLPAPQPGVAALFLKFSHRSRVDIAAVNLTLALRREAGVIRHARLFLGTVAPTPMRAVAAEKLLLGARPSAELIHAAACAARDESRPISDFRATREYKLKLVYALTRRALEKLTATP